MTAAPGVSLQEITPENRTAVEALTVDDAQSAYVAGVAESLLEAAEHPDARPWYRAVYAGATPVGFVMISDGITVDDPAYLGPYFLWRLLVDRRYQHLGYGAATLALVLDHLREHRPDAQVLLTSVSHEGRGAASPLGFYLRQGFRTTGRVHDGELVLELALRR
jgi:diamine N-acetyltransferase